MIETLFAAAISLGGYTDFCASSKGTTMECQAPTVKYVTEAQVKAVCRSQHANAGCFTREEWNVIYINKDLPADRQKAFIVHESTHLLQNLAGKWRATGINPCHRFRAEEQAYNVQNEWSFKNGVARVDITSPAHSFPTMKTNCETAVAVGLVRDAR